MNGWLSRVLRILRRNGSGVLTFVEPPRADPHAGWCGSWELTLVGQLPATRLTVYFSITSLAFNRWSISAPFGNISILALAPLILHVNTAPSC